MDRHEFAGAGAGHVGADAFDVFGIATEIDPCEATIGFLFGQTDAVIAGIASILIGVVATMAVRKHQGAVVEKDHARVPTGAAQLLHDRGLPAHAVVDGVKQQQLRAPLHQAKLGSALSLRKPRYTLTGLPLSHSAGENDSLTVAVPDRRFLRPNEAIPGVLSYSVQVRHQSGLWSTDAQAGR